MRTRHPNVLELAAFMIAAEVIGMDCHWMVGAGTPHQVLHWIAAFGIGIWCGNIAKRAA